MTGSQPRVALLGSTGFVGSAVHQALTRRGATVLAIPAPRVTTSARSVQDLVADLGDPTRRAQIDRLAERMDGCAAVINAAGMATATSAGRNDELFGANALLPGLVGRATPAGARYIHVSSAAVQGRRAVLDESREYEPFSPYSLAKVRAEELVADSGTCFRPTSVHGPGRRVTQSLIRLCSSPLASVAGRGERATPQVLADNVADAIAWTALGTEPLPDIILQPYEGLTTAELVRLLGDREPRHVPERMARAVVRTASGLGGYNGTVAGAARRLEMLWFGQAQSPGWLTNRWSPVAQRPAWEELRR